MNNNQESLYPENETPVEKEQAIVDPVVESVIMPTATTDIEVEVTEDEKMIYFQVINGHIEVPEGYLIDNGIRLDKEKIKKKKNVNPVLALANGIIERLAIKRQDIASKHTVNNKLNPETLSAEEANWLLAADYAINCMGENDKYINYIWLNTREGAQWRNEFNTKNNKRIGILTAPTKGIVGDEIVSGKRAMDLLDNLTGLGRSIKVPLYHTGIFVVLRAPTLSAYVELHQMMVEETIDLGRRSRGAIFSGDVAILSERIVDMVLNQVVSTNAFSREPAYLKGIIKAQDINALMWGAFAAAYPNGYDVGIACTNQECLHVSTELLDLRKLYWVDQNSLTERQIGILERTYSRENLSQEALIEYQEEFENNGIQRRYLIETYAERDDDDKSGLYVVFGSPTLAEYFSMAGEWISSIEQESVRAFSSGLRGEARNKYVKEQVKATSLLRYAHFIEHIEFVDEAGDGTATVVDRKDINDALIRLSGNPISINSFFMAINEYINKSLVSVIGVPNFPCPSCGFAHATEHSPSRHIIPLDVLGTFTTHYRELIELTNQVQ